MTKQKLNNELPCAIQKANKAALFYNRLMFLTFLPAALGIWLDAPIMIIGSVLAMFFAMSMSIRWSFLWAAAHINS